MRYCKYLSDGYIIGIGTGAGGVEITKKEYDVIMGNIKRKPEDTEAVTHRLKENLTWEAVGT